MFGRKGGVALSCAFFAAVVVAGACGDEDDKDNGSGGSGASSSGNLLELCVSYCQGEAVCDGEDPSTCPQECQELVDLTAASGCTGPWTAFYSCAMPALENCLPACPTELTAATTCVSTYCLENPSDPACQGTGGGGTGGSTGGTGTGGTGTGGGGTGGSTSTCPHMVSEAEFDCGAACNNVLLIADTCKDHPLVDGALQALLAALAGGTGAACRLACEQGTLGTHDQWRCFQGVATTDCSEIAGCTLVNCP